MSMCLRMFIVLVVAQETGLWGLLFPDQSGDMASSATNWTCSKGYVTSLDDSSDGWTDPRMEVWIWTGYDWMDIVDI